MMIQFLTFKSLCLPAHLIAISFYLLGCEMIDFVSMYRNVIRNIFLAKVAWQDLCCVRKIFVTGSMSMLKLLFLISYREFQDTTCYFVYFSPYLHQKIKLIHWREKRKLSNSKWLPISHPLFSPLNYFTRASQLAAGSQSHSTDRHGKISNHSNSQGGIVESI